MSGGLLWMVDRCDARRPARTEQAYGGKRSESYTATLTNEPCRLTEKKQRGFNSITAEWIVRTEYQLQLRQNADIQEGDEVTSITLQDGTVIDDTFKVDGGALERRGHMSQIKIVSLEKVS